MVLGDMQKMPFSLRTIHKLRRHLRGGIKGLLSFTYFAKGHFFSDTKSLSKQMELNYKTSTFLSQIFVLLFVFSSMKIAFNVKIDGI